MANLVGPRAAPQRTRPDYGTTGGRASVSSW